MANIKSINGNPIVLGSSGIEDKAITDEKLADGGVRSIVEGFGVLYDNSYELTPALSYGYFNASATRINDQSYVTGGTYQLLTVAQGMNIVGETTLSGVRPLVYEMAYENGSLVRKRSVAATGSSVTLENTQKGCLYSLGLRKTSGTWSSIPTEGFTFTIRSAAIDGMAASVGAAMDAVGDVNAAMSEGEIGFAVTLENGYHNATTGAWTSDTHHLCPRNFVRVPYGATLVAETDISGVTPTIKEFVDNGDSTYTRVRSSDGNPARLEGATPDKYYEFDLYGSQVSPIPTTGFEFSMVPAFLDSLVTQGGIRYSYNQSAKTLTITGSKARYTLQRVTDQSINLDAWRLYRGEILVDGTWQDMWYQSDAEGPVKLTNQSDYISGFHGDEIMDSVTVYIGTEELDLTASARGVCDAITLYQESTCYNATQQGGEAFKRYKKLVFEGNGFSVQQRWVALEDCTVHSGAMVLMQCYRNNMIGWDTDRLLPMQPITNGTSSDTFFDLDEETRVGTLYFDGDTSVSIEIEQGAEAIRTPPALAYYESQDRLKFYFYLHNGDELTVGDELVSKFSVMVR